VCSARRRFSCPSSVSCRLRTPRVPVRTGAGTEVGVLRRTTFLVASLALAAAFALYASAVAYRCDDGYIVYQYVKNALAGHGLVYAPGERVEGYTSFLWVALLWASAAASATGALPALGSALGTAIAAATVLGVSLFSWSLARERSAWGLLAPALLALHSSFVAWSTSGLETPLFAALLLAAAARHVRWLQRGGRAWPTALLFAALAMTRPEGLLFFAATTLHFLHAQRRTAPRRLGASAFAWAAAFLVLFAPWFLARWAWYGDVLPNTAHVKGGFSPALWPVGARYLIDYARDYGVAVLVPAAWILVSPGRRPWHGYLAVLVAPYLVYVVAVGGDGLAFHRFVAHVAPLLLLLVQAGSADLYRRLRERAPPRLRPAVAAAAIAATAAAAWTTTRQTALPLWWPERVRWLEARSGLRFPGDGRLHDYVWYDAYFVDRLAAAARWLDANAAPGSLVASTPAGSIAYHMRLPVLDMLGLNDRHIARSTPRYEGWLRAGHMKGDGAYVLDRAPAYILLGNVAVLPRPLSPAAMARQLVRRSEREIWRDPRFARHYERVSVRLAARGPFQWFTFYRRRDAGAR